MLEVMVYDTDKGIYIYKQSFKKIRLDQFAIELNRAYWVDAITDEEPEAA